MRPIISQQKGRLVRVLPSGKEITIVENDIWGNLQKKRKELICMGVDKSTLILRYMRY